MTAIERVWELAWLLFLRKKERSWSIVARNPLKTPEQIRQKLKKLLGEIERGEYEGKLAEARILVTILSEMLKSIRQDELEKQLAEIEDKLMMMKEEEKHAQN